MVDSSLSTMKLPSMMEQFGVYKKAVSSSFWLLSWIILMGFTDAKLNLVTKSYYCIFFPVTLHLLYFARLIVLKNHHHHYIPSVFNRNIYIIIFNEYYKHSSLFFIIFNEEKIYSDIYFIMCNCVWELNSQNRLMIG